MRWRIGAVLALASTLVVGYWEAIVPHPGARPRVVTRAAAGTLAHLGPLDATLVSLTRGSIGQAGPATSVPNGSVLLRAAVRITLRPDVPSAPGSAADPGSAAGSSPSSGCELRLAVPDGRTWLPVAGSGACRTGGSPESTSPSVPDVAWFVVPPGVDLGGLVVEVRTVGAEPRAVRLVPAPIS